MSKGRRGAPRRPRPCIRRALLAVSCAVCEPAQLRGGVVRGSCPNAAARETRRTAAHRLRSPRPRPRCAARRLARCRSADATCFQAARSGSCSTRCWSCRRPATTFSCTRRTTTRAAASPRRCSQARIGCACARVLVALTRVAPADGQRAPWVHVRGDWLPRTLFGRLHAVLAYARCFLVALAVLRAAQPFQVVVVDQVSAPIALLRAFGVLKARPRRRRYSPRAAR